MEIFDQSGDDLDEKSEFTINQSYAEQYNKWRRKEELQKLKDKYGDDINDDDDDEDESSSSSDSDDEVLDSKFDKAWLKAYSAVKYKDPKIYSKDVAFFDDNDDDQDEDTDDDNVETKKKSKPMFLKDYQRKMLLEKEGKYDDDEDNEKARKASVKGYYEEQEEIKKSFKSVLQDSDSESGEELLTARKKTKEEKEKEESDYSEWLKSQPAKDEEKAGVSLEFVKDDNLDESEKFLRDYILNKRYIEKNADRIPSYDEIVGGDDFSDEEEELEREETFERKFNFRFEEPDPEFIKSYPRTIKETVRRQDSSRKKKREEKKQRKEEEKQIVKEELKQLKNLKKREIMDKIKTIEQVSGGAELGLSIEDLEGDFDPEEYDKKMKEIFDKEYYNDEVDEMKPVFPEDDAIDDEYNWDKWAGNDAEENYDDGGPHCEDPNFNMDADFDPSHPGPSKRSKKKGKGKRKTKFAESVEQEKPVFDPSQKSFEDYINEYYELGYEDIVGGKPVKFKYRQVVANDYGLSTDEVLKAPDSELNKWVSVKKMSQYRTDEEEKMDIRTYAGKAKNVSKKLKILQSLQESDEPYEAEGSTSQQPSQNLTAVEGGPGKSKKKKKKKGKGQKPNIAMETPSVKPEVESKEAESESGEIKKKKKSKGQKRNITFETPSVKLEVESKQTVSETSEVKKEKLKKHKKDIDKSDDLSERLTTSESKSDNVDTTSDGASVSDKQLVPGKNKIRKKRKPMSNERLEAYGIKPKKFKFMKIKKL